MVKVLLFADGTGNARTGQFRTNVWKLYCALDSTPEIGQIAYYHDGVGTSAFAPLRLLGGIFGYGLARNVRALYAFLCRNLASQTDEIHLFGFSRGAFTVRILAGLIASEGVRHITDEADLAAWVSEAFCRYRRKRWLHQVGRFRRLLIRGAAHLQSKRKWNETLLKPRIQLVGVWDTVAAYGGPIIEMVRGFDRWIIPLSMADYTLNTKVLHGRHALSLDEEREAFLPLPWDEVGSENPERIKQVWFAGVHSDVGGGYADEGLSNIPLVWMMDEAKKLGVDFLPDAENTIRAAANAWAPMHDSRSGVAIAYRYQPRSINALMGLTLNSPLRDPASGNKPLLSRVVIHDSILSRIRDPDGYAPIVLPTAFESESGQQIHLPGNHRDTVWDLVSTRRTAQRLLLLTGMAAIFSPLYKPSGLFNYLDQGLSAPLGTVLNFIPLLPPWSKAAYASDGCWLLIFSVLAWFLIAWGNHQRIRINKLSAQMWASRKLALAAAAGPLLPKPSRSGHFINIRREILRRLRWQVLPSVFGLGYYVFALLVLMSGIIQLSLAVKETKGDLCNTSQAPSMNFNTSEPCHKLGFPVHEGHHYRVRIIPDRWADDSSPDTNRTRAPIMASPEGFTYVQSFSQRFHDTDAKRDHKFLWALRVGAAHFFGIVIRREISAHWFQPLIAIRNDKEPWLYKAVLSAKAGDDGGYYAHFVAPADGVTWIYVNDAYFPFLGNDKFYKNNAGRAGVEITPEY